VKRGKGSTCKNASLEKVKEGEGTCGLRSWGPEIKGDCESHLQSERQVSEVQPKGGRGGYPKKGGENDMTGEGILGIGRPDVRDKE